VAVKPTFPHTCIRRFFLEPRIHRPPSMRKQFYEFSTRRTGTAEQPSTHTASASSSAALADGVQRKLFYFQPSVLLASFAASLVPDEH
jgi:hypothetical protein